MVSIPGGCWPFFLILHFLLSRLSVPNQIPKKGATFLLICVAKNGFLDALHKRRMGKKLCLDIR